MQQKQDRNTHDERESKRRLWAPQTQPPQDRTMHDERESVGFISQPSLRALSLFSYHKKHRPTPSHPATTLRAHTWAGVGGVRGRRGWERLLRVDFDVVEGGEVEALGVRDAEEL
eukprot:953829-Rhodomonas_salina.1